MVMQDKLLINSVDVTAYRIRWDFDGEWDTAIDGLNIELGPSVSDALTITNGMSIELTRGFVTDTDETVFTGVITQIKPYVSYVKLVCKNDLIDAVKSADVKSWDKDIDTEAGVGSEIFKALCDHSSLSYDDTTVISTGTDAIYKIVKFVQNDEDDYQKMNELAEHYNYTISYDYDNSKVNFKPKGYTTYPVSLTVGTEIPGQIKWKENMEQLVNEVKIYGATVYDKVVDTFAGPNTEFTLSKTPEDTEVRIDHAGADTLQTRGQKDVGTLGTDFDYYIDVEEKTMTFNANVSDVWINYGAQVPMPVLLTDPVSIDTYGGPNKVSHFKKITFTDIKDVADAENRGRAFLQKYATPFIEAQNIPVTDSIISANRSFVPGDIVNIIDNYNNKDSTYFVSGIKKSWPHVYDKITIGDNIWRTEDWQAVQMKKIDQLFKELNKNQGILISTIDLSRSTISERRYSYITHTDRADDDLIVFILDSPEFGHLNRQYLGDSNTAATTIHFMQGNNTYKEYCYDTDFHDSANSTATFNTGTNKITFTSGQIWYSLAIAQGVSYNYCTINLGSTTGTLKLEISADGKVNWQEITVDTRTAITDSDTTGFYMRITENGASTAEVGSSFLTTGKFDDSAITMLLEE